jgi:Pentapeptide repeats (8 copies)
MKKGNLKRVAAVAPLILIGAAVAYMASAASAQDPTIDGTFCSSPTIPPSMFCMQATFNGQTAEGYTGHEAALTLAPGTYTLTVHDNSSAHDFVFRSCPGVTTSCAPGTGSSQAITSLADNCTIPTDTCVTGVSTSLDLTAGTYRLYCNAGLGGPFYHEGRGMFVDIVVAANAGSNLKGANLENALQPNVDFRGANLSRADGDGGNFSGAQFEGANLSGSSFVNANLTGAALQDSNLQGANFTGANLTGADLDRANVYKVTWSNTTCPDGTNSNADGGTCKGHL